ncbi:hypothetical protein [Bartonella rattimassiliensis]|nr:hypothetical protein [Bartonella rattimassiliensis]
MKLGRGGYRAFVGDRSAVFEGAGLFCAWGWRMAAARGFQEKK